MFFGTVLPSLGLLWSADVNPSNSDCAALRAMTGHERESAVILLVFFIQLVKLCGAIHYFDFSGLRFPFSLLFDHQSTFVLRRMDRSLTQEPSDCAAGLWVIYLFYNTITPTVY